MTNSLSSLMPQTEFHNDDDDGYKQLQCEQVQIVDICRSPSKAFIPTNNRWRQEKCKKLSLPLPVKSNDGCRIHKVLGKPVKMKEIIGGGNCLFRAISQEVCLIEDNCLVKAAFRLRHGRTAAMNN